MMKRRVSHKEFLCGLMIAAVFLVRFVAGAFGMTEGASVVEMIATAVFTVIVILVGHAVSDIEEVDDPIRSVVNDLLGALGFVVAGTAILTVICAAANEKMEGGTFLEVFLNARGVVILALSWIVLLGVLRTLFMAVNSPEEPGDEPSALLPPLGAAAVTGILLCSALMVFHMVVYSYPLRTGGESSLTWVRTLLDVIKNSDQPFNNCFDPHPLTWESLFESAVQSFIPNKVAYICCAITPFLIVTLICFGEKCAELIREKHKQIKHVVDILTTKVKELIYSQIKPPVPKGYCSCCGKQQPIGMVLPFSLDHIKVEKEDIVPDIQNHWSDRCRNDGVVSLEEMNARPVTIVKPRAVVCSPDGTRLHGSDFVCTVCGCTIAQDLSGKRLYGTEIVSVIVFGITHVGKTSLMEILYSICQHLAAEGSYESLYWKKIFGNYPELPEPTKGNIFKSVPLLLEYPDGSVLNFSDLAGENSEQQSHGNDKCVRLLCVNLLDQESVSNAVKTLKITSRIHARKMVVCFTQCDKYHFAVDEMMDSKSVRQRSKNILAFLRETPEYAEIASVADSISETVQLTFTFVSATGKPCDGREIIGEPEPRYLDELIHALRR